MTSCNSDRPATTTGPEPAAPTVQTAPDITTGTVNFKITFASWGSGNAKAAAIKAIDKVTAFVNNAAGNPVTQADLDIADSVARGRLTVPAQDNLQVTLVYFDGEVVRYIGQDEDVDVPAGAETTAEVEVAFQGVQVEAPESAQPGASYAITWGARPFATGYVLEEASQEDFSDANTIYQGADTNFTVDAKGATGTFYYRVRTNTSYGAGPLPVTINAVATLSSEAEGTIVVETPVPSDVPATGGNELVVTTPAGTEHELVLVPEGDFIRGADDEEVDEFPAHTVLLSTFYIDKFEVTNARYVEFLNDLAKNTDDQGNALLDLSGTSVQIRTNANTTFFAVKDAVFADHPVVHVTWFGAKAYCDWAGMRLPTEAEWEKAARGTDGRTYPWGEDINPTKANYGTDACCNGDDRDGYLETAPVGSFPDGVSPYGGLDMAGNVWEWVNDWYDEVYYTTFVRNSVPDPQGSESGSLRVIRGGSWYGNPGNLRATNRGGALRTTSSTMWVSVAPGDLKTNIYVIL